MAHTSCILDKQGYMHARACTRLLGFQGRPFVPPLHSVFLIVTELLRTRNRYTPNGNRTQKRWLHSCHQPCLVFQCHRHVSEPCSEMILLCTLCRHFYGFFICVDLQTCDLYVVIMTVISVVPGESAAISGGQYTQYTWWGNYLSHFKKKYPQRRSKGF
jgi:hypothetical protein